MIERVLIEELHHQLSERGKQKLNDPNDQMEKRTSMHILLLQKNYMPVCVLLYTHTCKQFLKMNRENES